MNLLSLKTFCFFYLTFLFILEGVPFRGIGSFLVRVKCSISDELRYRKTSFHQYQDQIELFWNQSIDAFRNGQLRRSIILQQELDEYRSKFDKLYNNITVALQSQKDYLQELNNVVIRPRQIDQSLEDFRRFYNETLYQAFLSGGPSVKVSLRINVTDTINAQIEVLNKQMKKNWDSLIKSSQESRNAAEEVVRDTFKEFAHFQEAIVEKFEDSAVELFPNSGVTKADLRARRKLLDAHIKRLEKEGSLWIENRFRDLEMSLKSLQERAKNSETIYEELINKRRSNLHYTVMNDMTLNKVLQMIDPKDKGWKLIKSEDGFDVYRKFTADTSKLACVKCSGIVRACPEKIFALLEDNTRVKEYNTLFDQGRDIEIVAENTKITWTLATPIFPFKARDFCTVIHFRKLKDGTLVVLNRATNHPGAPTMNQYVRASILVGANIIQPIAGKPNLSKLTMITQVDPGGFIPPMVVNQLCALGPIGFMKNIEAVANKPLSRRALMGRNGNNSREGQ